MLTSSMACATQASRAAGSSPSTACVGGTAGGGARRATTGGTGALARDAVRLAHPASSAAPARLASHWRRVGGRCGVRSVEKWGIWVLLR
ncbi:hypothetical protein [Ottowia sp. SB7-C50]|uniref:hypothetical protein n=1 Tax=Ottowia sp. SB7-C50 TaxID=3081231 RepID=UPI002953E582|nr:hypothetical protein [Ottowia sp. SB7-C50]WOP17195.1 hypothetical protein R0D99_04030 [Ottowia sp. SB7-C50]